MSTRPRRSMLYVPGDKARALEKAKTLPVDSIIIDLEDAVAPDRKAAARDAIEQAVSGWEKRHCELILRVGGLRIAEDFALAARLPLDGLLLPKVESAAMLAEAETRTSLALWCMIETPLGVLRAGEIAGVSSVAGLIAGTNDLAKDLHARHVPGRAPLLPALASILLAARAFGRAAIDGVYLDLDDAEGFERDCMQGRDMGFDGKTLVHPSTIDTANRIFAPDAGEIERARSIVTAWDAARAQGLGVARIDGQMVEQLHVDDARRILALADAVAAPRNDSAA
ncbi:HpcH/HpaI aldolase/citrate lyase family protein [Stakelama pacifica]|uniref:Citrate lyase subunit beta/citryl-CoA lyase n=1 Tax=Stakelama pacifica TaxID=517720 RepID=A0A4R6FII3_9SPHN|nr:CoA ester lyase [Stakelama pacifica]TDN80304.1 citrate lyase subunit beta/citryl-CoA lyase [Stakelama pacifica]GGO97927.1 CoA ester lyase [Stakelama pacifica]